MNLAQAVLLLVEDDPNDVLLIQRALNKARIANPVVVVRDGEEAVRYLGGLDPYGDREAHPLPMLVLLDLKLPRRTGFEVLEWVRAQPGLKRLPIVIMTSSRETPDINRAYDLGASSYLVKPGEFQDLMRLVDSLHLYWMVLNEHPSLEP